jgi:hypothetical protein
VAHVNERCENTHRNTHASTHLLLLLLLLLAAAAAAAAEWCDVFDFFVLNTKPSIDSTTTSRSSGVARFVDRRRARFDRDVPDAFVGVPSGERAYVRCCAYCVLRASDIAADAFVSRCIVGFFVCLCVWLTQN